MSALAVGLRSAFIGLPNIQPITAMFFVSVLYLGLVDGFLIMALTMSISGFIFGFGPWVFNQILAFGILMALWSLIAPRLSLVCQIALVTILSFLYGVLLDYQSKGQGQVTLILKTEKESKKKSVEFKKGDTVLDVLKEIYPVQENDGFITEIDGISQDKEKGIYWMFDVNGKIGEKAANQLKVQDGDEIKFYQEKYN